MKQAQRKLEAAQRLLELGAYDDAVSRAYYAMFHASTAALLTEGAHPNTHEGVLTEFGRLLVKTNKVAAGLRAALVRAKAFREKADDVPSFEGPTTVAEDVLHSAEEFVRQMERYLRRREPG